MTKTQAAFVSLSLAVPAMVFRAFVITRLWAWFVVPLGVMEIGVAHALGLVITLGVIRNKDVEDKPAPPWMQGVSKVGCTVVAFTDLAVLVEHGNGKSWLPKSRCEIEPADAEVGDEVTVTLPEPLATEKGMV